MRGIRLPKQEKAIFCWKVTPDGKIQKFDPITEYSKCTYGKEIRLIMKVDSHICYTKESALNKLLNERVYSYENDDEKAKEIIAKSIRRKMVIAKNDYERLKEQYELVTKTQI